MDSDRQVSTLDHRTFARAGGVAAVGASTGSSRPFHTHPDVHEAVIISGMGALRLEEREEALVPGDVLFVNLRQPTPSSTRDPRCSASCAWTATWVEAHCNTQGLVAVSSCVQPIVRSEEHDGRQPTRFQ